MSVPQSDPMLFGFGPAILFWLLAGLLALISGLVLANRRSRGPLAGHGSGTSVDERGVPAGLVSTQSVNPTISNNDPGGAER